MNIQLLSDLHLETHPHFTPEVAPSADVLILAGDIGSYQAGSMLLGPTRSRLWLGAFLAAQRFRGLAGTCFLCARQS